MSGMELLEEKVADKRNGELWESVQAFADLIEFPLDSFQISLIVLTLKKRSVWHISAMRKIGKTHILGFMLLFLGSIGYSGVYSNHKLEFVKEVFEFVKPYAEELKKLGFVKRIEPSHGFLNIYFASGGTVYFRTRSSGFGRGYMKLDFVFWDEAQKTKSAQRKEISGALYTSALKLEVYVGNPATLEDTMAFPDSPFTQAKRSARKNFIEFSGAPQYSPDLELTPELLAECNPNAHRLGDLTELIKAEFDADKKHEEVAAELFGIWNLPPDVDKVEPEFSSTQIQKMLTKTHSKAASFYLSVAIDYKSSEAFMVISDGVIMEVAEVIELPHGSVEPVSTWILANKNRFRNAFIMGTAKGKVLVELLAPIKRKITVVQPQAFAVSLARFLQQVKSETLKVYETEDVRSALGSFWIAFDQKTNAPVARAATPESVSLIMSLMMGSVDEKAADRIRKSSGAASENQPEVEIPTTPKELDPMAAYFAAQKRRKENV